MKQHITKEQWDELTKEQQKKFDNTLLFNCNCSYCAEDSFRLAIIGQMIEFLGDDYFYFGKDVVGWQLKSGSYKNIRNKEFCDALWEAVKYKLKDN